MMNKKIEFFTKWNKYDYYEMILQIKKDVRGKCIDIGCGRGEIVYSLPDCVGIDLKEHNTWQKDKRKFIKADVFSFEPSEKFDTIILNNSLQYILKRDPFKNIRLIAKKEAHIIIIVPTIFFLINNYIDLIKSILLKVIYKKGFGYKHLLVHAKVSFSNPLSEFITYIFWTSIIKKHLKIKETHIFRKGINIYYLCNLKQ